LISIYNSYIYFIIALLYPPTRHTRTFFRRSLAALLLLRFASRQSQCWQPVFCLTKENKKRPCKGSWASRHKSFITACSASTLVQRPGGTHNSISCVL